MGFLDDLKRMLRRETADAKEWLDESVAGANASLDRAERRIAADPDERLQATLDDIAANDDAFAALQAKADAAAARPAARAELDREPRTDISPADASPADASPADASPTDASPADVPHDPTTDDSTTDQT